MNVIVINKLTKSYKKSRGIIDVSFAVKKGEIFGFIGPNGAGKSTTIRTLLGFIKAETGTAKVFGLDVKKDSVEIKKRTGYLPAEVNYTENMKAIDLLKYTAEFYKLDADAKINELAKRLRLDLHKKVDEFSLGNKKKVAIIQALLHSPELLILDEPTSGLDPLMQKEFFDILMEYNKAGTTILFSSHVLSEVQQYCERVAIIREGKIVSVTAVDELTSNNFRKVSYVTKEGQEKDFVFRGNVNELTAEVAKLTLQDLKIEEPSLEEIFLTLYERTE